MRTRAIWTRLSNHAASRALFETRPVSFDSQHTARRALLHPGEVEGQQTEGCHPPTSFRPPERQKARLDRPTREPANRCRFKEQARGPAGLLGWKEALGMEPVPGLAASPFAIGPGRRDRKQAVVSREVRT